MSKPNQHWASRQSWFGLPMWGVIVAVSTVAVVVLVGIIVFAVSVSGHSESWKQGYNWGDRAIGLLQVNISPNGACDAQYTWAIYSGDKINHADFMAGCLARLKERGY